MKKKLQNIFSIATLLFMSSAIAQNSEGGKPYTFVNQNKISTSVSFVNLPAFDLASMQAEDAINDQSKGPFRFGYNHMVQLNLNNSGTWTTLANGDRVWQLGISSPGAHSLNLAFDDFYMPEGGKLFIYNIDKSYVIGAFTTLNNQEDKNFATDLIPGDAIILEYYEPAAVSNQGRINLFRATHGYRGVEDYVKTFGGSGSCQVNVNCPFGANWQNDKRSVVCLVSGGSEFCTGALVNDVPMDKKPYILTANHCGSSGFGTWVFRFKWEAPGCSNPGSSPSTTASLTGSVQRSFSANSDFSLVEITGGLIGGTVPTTYNPYFAGWSNINTPADSVWCIHHPSGDIKKISKASTPCISTAWSGTPANSHWQTGTWTTACTEPGSSGSPLFDQNHRIVGQLHGGPSACGLAASSMYDVYGKFSVSWLGGGTSGTQLKAWLDPANTGATTLNGWDPAVTSVSRIDNSSEVTIYPNPNDGEFNINFNFSTSSNIHVNVFNVLGKVVSSKSITNMSIGTFSLNMPSESAGMYFVEITTDNEKIVKKINIIK